MISWPHRALSKRHISIAVCAAFLLMLLLCSSDAAAQINTNLDKDGNPRTDVIPPDNSDLDEIIKNLEAIRAFTQNCKNMECPQLDCFKAQDLLAALTSTETVLEHLARWLRIANDAHMAHFESLVEMGKITAENLARAQDALAWQQFLHDLGSNLLDIASVADYVKDLMEEPDIAQGIDQWKKRGGDSPANEVLNHIDSFYEALKDFESGLDNMSGHLAGGDGTGTPLGDMTPEGLFGLSQEDINNHKSTLSDIKETIEKAVRNGKDWRQTLRKGGAAAIGQIAGRYLKAYDEKLMKERQERIDNLINDLAASDRVQATAYRNLQKVQRRRFKAEDALAAIQGLDKALRDCMQRANCGTGYHTQVRIEDFIDYGPNGERIESWGRALMYLNNALDMERSRLGELPDLQDHCEKSRDDAVGLTGGDSETPDITIGHDNPTWCSYTPGTPASVPIDGDDPGDAPPPGTITPPEDEDDPRDTSPPTGGADDDARDISSKPCEQELKLLKSFLEKHGAELERQLNDPDTPPEKAARIAHDLGEVNKRIAELEKLCGGEEPGDAQTDSDDGSETRDLPGEDPKDTDEPEKPETPEPTFTVYIKAKATVLSGGNDAKAIAGQQVKLFVPAVTDPALPGTGVQKPQTDHAEAPIQGITNDAGDLALSVPTELIDLSLSGDYPSSVEVPIDTTLQKSSNVRVAGNNPQIAVSSIPGSARDFLTDVTVIRNSVFLTFMYPSSMHVSMDRILVYIPGFMEIEDNYCRDKQEKSDDPYYLGKGAWNQNYDDQWAIKRVGLTQDESSAWNKLGNNPKSVIVAVIDSGLDWHHLDFDWQNLWQNPREIPDNGKDDDNNGYIDDIIGWDFFAKNNKPWDHDGHGTHVSGVIAATQGNNIGIAGINPYARIMVLKAINNFGHTRASYLAKAVKYAADNGARIINMSVGGKNLSTIEKEAVNYALSKGVLIVVASGNEGINVSDFGIAGLNSDGILTVTATGPDNKRSGFSNWGPQIDIAAPGIDVLGLRARRTDTMRDIPGVAYQNGANFVGDDSRYYRGSGTSFAAPIVSGVASLVLSRHPELSGREVARILKQSATDIDTPGLDQYSGYGLVNAAAALEASPNFFIHSVINNVRAIQGTSGVELEISGTANADSFKYASVAIGAGEDPSSWKNVIQVKQSIENNVLGTIPAKEFAGAKVWIIRLETEHRLGMKREFRFRLAVE